MSTLPRTGPGRPRLTRADLEHAPDDGCRYELVDGELLVTPAPGYRHQRVCLLLASLLDRSCPPSLVTLTAPFAVGLADDTEVQPDVLVATRSALTEVDLPGAPLLAVEVLSASTRRSDLTLKRERYERAGVASYWVVDPAGPSLLVHELRDGAYGEAVRVGPEDTWQATAPFPVTVRPGDLVD